MVDYEYEIYVYLSRTGEIVLSDVCEHRGSNNPA